jgi:transcriptional regulator with XRE-family HTH domain
MDYGFALRELRKYHNLSLEEIANTGVFKLEDLKKIEEGKIKEIKNQGFYINKLAEYFGIPLSAFELMSRTEEDISKNKIEGYRHSIESTYNFIKSCSEISENISL